MADRFRTFPNMQEASRLRRNNIIASFLAATLICCGAMTGCPDEVPDRHAKDSLLYVLQPDAVSIDTLKSAAFTYLILEPSRDGTAAAEFTADEIGQIKFGGPCKKRILAYLSIGEAEQVRDYWSDAWVDAQGALVIGSAPPWLGPRNPDFPDNFKVRYWDPAWQALLFGQSSGPGITPLDRIIDAGFDGVYLDIIDAYEFWSEEFQPPELSRMEARSRMIDLIASIATYARVTRGAADFLVFPQNASEIILDSGGQFDSETDRYFSSVNGIGQEDLFYDELSRQDETFTTAVIANLNEFILHDKIVLVTDYIVSTSNGAASANDPRAFDFFQRSRAAGYIPYAAVQNRDLSIVQKMKMADGWSFEQPTACE